jgi:hypothetical protein
MVYPVVGTGWEETGPSGYTYAAVLVRTDDAQEAALAALREVRFSGWVAPPDERGWLVAVAAAGAGTVAAGRRGVLGVGEWLGDRFTTLAVLVVDDRQLVLALWSDGEERGRYVSDPSWGTDDDEGVLSDPVGAEVAAELAAACGRPDAADRLADLLAEELDAESMIESERLVGVLDLLDLPRWVVNASTLPREVPLGPRSRDLTRLGAGARGLSGRVRGWAADLVRRRRPPPPVLADPPRTGGVDPWLL